MIVGLLSILTFSIVCCSEDYIAIDRDPPKLDDSRCDPKNGAKGVNPADYPEKIVLAFSEAVLDARVISITPYFKTSDELIADGRVLKIAFLQYDMPYEQEYNITVICRDLAGNWAKLEYSFTTMRKVQ